MKRNNVFQDKQKLFLFVCTLFISLLSYTNKSKLYFRQNLKNNIESSCRKAWYTEDIVCFFPLESIQLQVLITTTAARITIRNLFSNCIAFCDWKNENQGSPISLLKLFSPGVSAQGQAPVNLGFQSGTKGHHGNQREQHLCSRLLEQND